MSTDDYILLAAEVDGPPARSDDAHGGDWQLSVTLQLWAPVGDHFEALYEFDVGSLNFAGLVPNKSHSGGLIDPAKVKYIVDGHYIGALVERSALSAIQDADKLSFVAKAEPQIFIENGRPASHTGVITGWEERRPQWCPNADQTIPINSYKR